eukprot:CAMPEP_0185755022 /NCGR_PEP_ID=MMETSP1174-20130828/13573_1 /TAXON_ID=35687 /ORGANISM="Dictyocha speculum, Strain CCMP1381" /LENGTH=51 /DNA_ID=CAMNT_0028433435 /DNA_START=47 /DNA_END=199 /DNA_ORIENTATION=-
MSEALDTKGFPPHLVDLIWQPKGDLVDVMGGDQETAFVAFLEALEDNEDVQ